MRSSPEKTPIPESAARAGAARGLRILLPALALALSPAAPARAEAPPVPEIRRGPLRVRFDPAGRSLAVAHDEAGPILTSGTVTAHAAGRAVASSDPALPLRAALAAGGTAMTLTFGDLLTLEVRIREAEAVELTARGGRGGLWTCQAAPTAGARALAAYLLHERSRDRNVLTTVLGRASVPGARSLFDPERDLAVTARAAGTVRWVPADGWWLETIARPGELLLSLQLHPHYYRDTLDIRSYAPIDKRSYWTTAPVVAMTWYGIEGWKGRPAQTKEWLEPQIDWVAKHLLPYAERLVFQLDDNYLQDDDRYLRDLSDLIRSRGLIPGVWFTPFAVAPAKLAAEHPDWFLHDQEGKLLEAFGGVNFSDVGGHTSYVLNVTSPEAVDAWYAMFWRKASETWNYDFFKIDGQPAVAERYRQSADGGGSAGYRLGLRMARRIVGPEKFVNGCWGIALDGGGTMNGARTGPDTGLWPHACEFIVRWNFLNNVLWWCDPDAAANQYQAPVERVRLNAQARVLTGQQFLTDDVWTRVPPENLRVWQRSFPTLDIRPANLYRIDDWRRYDVFRLRVGRPWGSRDLAGLFNYDGRTARKTLDLGRLSLEASQVHVYEYWSGTYLGRYRSDAAIARRLGPHEGQLFALVPAAGDRPVLLSTSRHATQGGLDVEEVTWVRTEERWTVTGRSSHLVAADPYEIVFATGRFRVHSAAASGGEARVESAPGLARVRFEPQAAGEATWEVSFVPLAGRALSASPPELEVAAGDEARIELVSHGPEDFPWRAVTSDPRLAVEPASGLLLPWPAAMEIRVTATAGDLEPGGTLSGWIEIHGEAAAGSPRRIAVRVTAPEPENLAARAMARASSRWEDQLDYDARRVNDGLLATRWNSARGDTSGAWVELGWKEPVAFDRVVIRECVDFGNRIQAWRLEAGDGKLRVIARGGEVGSEGVVRLEEPVTARRLRLVVERAAETPTIRELEVFRLKEAP